MRSIEKRLLIGMRKFNCRPGGTLYELLVCCCIGTRAQILEAPCTVIARLDPDEPELYLEHLRVLVHLGMAIGKASRWACAVSPEKISLKILNEISTPKDSKASILALEQIQLCLKHEELPVS